MPSTTNTALDKVATKPTWSSLFKGKEGIVFYEHKIINMINAMQGDQ